MAFDWDPDHDADDMIAEGKYVGEIMEAVETTSKGGENKEKKPMLKFKVELNTPKGSKKLDAYHMIDTSDRRAELRLIFCKPGEEKVRMSDTMLIGRKVLAVVKHETFNERLQPRISRLEPLTADAAKAAGPGKVETAGVKDDFFG